MTILSRAMASCLMICLISPITSSAQSPSPTPDAALLYRETPEQNLGEINRLFQEAASPDEPLFVMNKASALKLQQAKLERDEYKKLFEETKSKIEVPWWLSPETFVGATLLGIGAGFAIGYAIK